MIQELQVGHGSFGLQAQRTHFDFFLFLRSSKGRESRNVKKKPGTDLSLCNQSEILELQRNSGDWGKIVEEIVRIEKKVFPKHESLAKSFEEEAKKRNGGLIYSLIGGEVAGYVMYSWPSSLYASITKLAVKENYRGQGHGEALLKAAIEKCKTRKIHRISLHVDPLRTAALNLYKKLDFQVDSLVESYYSLDRDAYRMYLDLDTEVNC